MLVAAHGEVEGNLQNTLNLRAIIDVGIVSLLIVLILLAEIHSTRQLADNDEVGAFDELFLQRALMKQAVECGYRAHIGKESELLAHGQQTGFRAHLQRGVVVEAGITDSGKEHCVSIHTSLESLVGEGVATSIDAMGAADGFLISKLVAELLRHNVQHIDSLRHNLRSYTVARQNCNFEFHLNCC